MIRGVPVSSCSHPVPHTLREASNNASLTLFLNRTDIIPKIHALQLRTPARLTTRSRATEPLKTKCESNRIGAILEVLFIQVISVLGRLVWTDRTCSLPGRGGSNTRVTGERSHVRRCLFNAFVIGVR